ncbi:putative zinc finger CCHC domain-containing protein [Sesamum alatum]|uniref:Zinc finger CCHC domain-containing protein n=1 Tax=Sesamum alatum TaxID=300844 RepID=A0AAE1Y375_9LAMI|nr:putative zinc finger CCHC domain-containing protein [Sesamum alatum]
MEEEGGGFRLSKKSSDKGGEVDYKTKAGTAWSHSFLNQKPWHPLSYPNQRRKWIAEQTHSQKERRAEEVAREYAQEQEFLRQTALISKKEKEKLEMMKAVSFMYVKPPGYNAESAKAAEMADEKKKQEPSLDGASSSMKKETTTTAAEKKKPVPKDVFGRALPTEEQFEVLKNAPRLETGVPGRVKPFGIEIRNVKCLRCGNYGHQSGDRECPLKDSIMPNEESRLKRDDPLTAIQAQTDEPLKWELKQKPGMSPPRGGFDPDDPNQQIVAEDIFDEYGGFLGETNIPELLTNFSSSKTKKKPSKSKHRRRRSSPASDDQGSGSSSGDDRRKWKSKKRHKRKKRKHSETSSSESSDDTRHKKRRNRHKHRHSSSSDASDSDELHRSRHNLRHRHSHRHRDRDRQHNRRHGSGSTSD